MNWVFKLIEGFIEYLTSGGGLDRHTR